MQGQRLRVKRVVPKEFRGDQSRKRKPKRRHTRAIECVRRATNSKVWREGCIRHGSVWKAHERQDKGSFGVVCTGNFERWTVDVS